MSFQKKNQKNILQLNNKMKNLTPNNKPYNYYIYYLNFIIRINLINKYLIFVM